MENHKKTHIGGGTGGEVGGIVFLVFSLFFLICEGLFGLFFDYFWIVFWFLTVFFRFLLELLKNLRFPWFLRTCATANAFFCFITIPSIFLARTAVILTDNADAVYMANFIWVCNVQNLIFRVSFYSLMGGAKGGGYHVYIYIYMYIHIYMLQPPAFLAPPPGGRIRYPWVCKDIYGNKGYPWIYIDIHGYQ